MPSGADEVIVTGVTGAVTAGLMNRTAPLADSLAGQAIRTGKPRLVTGEGRAAAAAELGADIGPLIVVPLAAGEQVRGALMLGRLAARPEFTDTDLDMAASFAGNAAVAMELARARADQITRPRQKTATGSRATGANVLKRPNRLNVRSGSVAGPPPKRGRCPGRRISRVTSTAGVTVMAAATIWHGSLLRLMMSSLRPAGARLPRPTIPLRWPALRDLAAGRGDLLAEVAGVLGEFSVGETFRLDAQDLRL